MQRICAVVFALLFCLFSADVALTAPSCESQLLRDWSRDGGIDRVYEPPCYENAIARLPADLRDYTDAEEVIERALASVLRTRLRDTAAPGTPVARADQDASPLPMLLAALVALSLVVLAGGSLSYLARRGTSHGDSDSTA